MFQTKNYSDEYDSVQRPYIPGEYRGNITFNSDFPEGFPQNKAFNPDFPEGFPQNKAFNPDFPVGFPQNKAVNPDFPEGYPQNTAVNPDFPEGYPQNYAANPDLPNIERPQNPDLRRGSLYDRPPCPLADEGVASANGCTGLVTREAAEGEDAAAYRDLADIPPHS